MPLFTPVDGTHEANDATRWSRPSSRWSRYVAERFDLRPLLPPFEWDTALDGVTGDSTTWRLNGKHLYHHLVPPRCPERRVPPDETLVIAFSHGVNVALHAFAYGLQGRLISVNPPIRADLKGVLALARPNLIRWVNLYGNWKDIWAVLGGIRDGHWGIRRKYPEDNDLDPRPDAQFLVPGGHGAALRDDRHFVSWELWLNEVMK